MTKRQVFYSFHFKNDSWRAGQVRNIGVVEGNTPVSSNEWEEVKRKGENSIKKWINSHMEYRSCVIVLIHCCPEKFYHKVGCSTEPASGTLTGVVG